MPFRLPTPKSGLFKHPVVGLWRGTKALKRSLSVLEIHDDVGVERGEERGQGLGERTPLCGEVMLKALDDVVRTFLENDDPNLDSDGGCARCHGSRVGVPAHVHKPGER